MTGRPSLSRAAELRAGPRARGGRLGAKVSDGVRGEPTTGLAWEVGIKGIEARIIFCKTSTVLF